MGEITQRGRFANDSKEVILDAMVSDLEASWGQDLPDEAASVARDIYEPVATRLAEAQRDIGLVLDAAQIEHASGAALELLCALIGVQRERAKKARGIVTFSRDEPADADYVIKKYSVVQTSGSTPLKFVTTEQATLHEGETSVDVPIEAEYGGADWNVGAGAIRIIPGNITGIHGVTNPEPTFDGQDPEEDDELRERAQEQLANGARATGPALVSAVKAVQGVTNVSILINDTPDENGRGYGLPPHSFEMIVTHDGERETLEDVAQALMDTKAVGDYSVVGENGQPLDESAEFVVNGEIETELPNGQTHPVGFSEAVHKPIYVDASFTYDPVDYPGDDEVKDAIVDYIGGWTSTGFEQDGELSTNHDVLYGEVEFAIRSVPGVYDVSNLYIGTSANPTGTDNIEVGAFEQAICDGREGSDHITLDSTER